MCLYNILVRLGNLKFYDVLVQRQNHTARYTLFRPLSLHYNYVCKKCVT